jgi:hypothetical protein
MDWDPSIWHTPWEKEGGGGEGTRWHVVFYKAIKISGAFLHRQKVKVRQDDHLSTKWISKSIIAEVQDENSTYCN